MMPYYYGGLAILIVSAIGFIDCARNFLIEKRAIIFYVWAMKFTGWFNIPENVFHSSSEVSRL